MEAQKNSLVTRSQPQTSKQPGLSSEEAIRQFLVKAGEVYRQPITPALVSIWVDELSGYSADKLSHLLRHVLRTFKADYGRTFPTIADVLEPLRKAEENATPQAAIEAWDHVLALRRQYWNPDAPGGFWSGMPKLSERVQAACRASGVFRDFETTEGLYTWAKKAFIESFTNWGETEQNKFLLPDGEIKNLLAGFAQTKALPGPRVDWQELRERGETYRAEMTTHGESLEKLAAPICETPQAIDFEGRSAELKRQADLIKAKYPSKKEATA
jgi:hypothetical protein